MQTTSSSLCCFCHKRNPRKEHFFSNALWLKPTCTGHKGVLYCEACFLEKVYLLKEKGLPTSFASLQAPACPTCGKEVVVTTDLMSEATLFDPETQNERMFLASLQAFPSWTIHGQMRFFMNLVVMFIFHINLFFMKMFPGAETSSECDRLLALDFCPEHMAEIRETSVEEAREQTLRAMRFLFRTFDALQTGNRKGRSLPVKIFCDIWGHFIANIFCLQEFRKIVPDDLRHFQDWIDKNAPGHIIREGAQLIGHTDVGDICRFKGTA